MPIGVPSLKPSRRLRFWKPKPGGPYLLRLVAPQDFPALARAHGIDPNAGAFAVWGRWWRAAIRSTAAPASCTWRAASSACA